MADVRYIIEVTIPTKSDVQVVSAMQNVDITPVIQERVLDFTVCSDSTAIFAPGTVRRTIIAALTAEFEAKFPGFNNQLHALENAFYMRFSKELPARVIESVNIGAFCP